MYIIHEMFKLVKALLCAMVALSAGFGYLLAGGSAYGTLLAVVFGIFFLACAGAALNSIQEKELDGLDERTRLRPLVTGTLSLPAAYGIMTICLVAGTGLLYGCLDSRAPVFLGLTALLIYNAIYTPLKTKTEFALLAGGISGALPPLIGWISGGGEATAPLIWAVMVLFFLWQPPHFCLIVLRDGQKTPDRRLSHLGVRYSPDKVKRIVAVWMLAFTNVSLLFTLLPDLLPDPFRVGLALSACLFLTLFLIHLLRSATPRYSLLFASLNSYLVGLMMLLAVGTALQT